MARPAIVIGLGGTGQWVLTYLKSELMELNGGVLPNEVQLLEFDTQSPDVKLLGAGGVANAADARMGQLTDAQVGNIRLDKNNEFFQIGGQLFDVIKEIINANPPRPEFDWLDTGYLQNLGPLVCNTVYGAGAYRQLGRLSLFKNVSAVYHRLFQGMQRGQAAIGQQMLGAGGAQNNALQVIIVTSLAGGTGAGTFIDIAWLLRTAAKRLNFSNYSLSAFIVMPTAWEQAGQSTDKRLRSYAAWKELDRFMLNPVNLQDAPRIVYSPDINPPLEAVCDTRIFDNTYLIDPVRTVNSLAQKRPEDSTYPVVSQVIASLLDNQIGQVLAQDMSNVAASIGQIPYDVYHHSAGAFTFKTPHNFAKQQSSNEYTMAVLERFLEPDYGPAGEAISIRQDRNQEAQPATTSHGAGSFLLADQHGALQNNALLPHIELVSAKGGELDKYAIEEALKVVDRRGATFQALTTKVIDPQLSTELNTLVNERIWRVVPPSGDRPNATPSSIKQQVLNAVDAKDVEWYGQWGFVADPKNPTVQIPTRVTEGSKVQVLRRTANDLADNYKALLKEWTSRQLNGIDADPSKAKGGKLGYVIGVFDQLNAKFDKYLAYLENVRERISKGQTRAKRVEARDKARKNYDLMAGKECFFAFFDNNVHPQAREAERAYLRSSDKLFEYYLSEFVLNSQGDAVRAMQKFTKASKENLERWVRLLATGKHDGDPVDHYNGLYDFGWTIVRKGVNGLQSEINMGNPNFEQNQTLTGVQQMLDVQSANTHYQNNNRVAAYAKVKPQIIPYTIQDEIKDGLDTFVWTVNKQVGGQTLDFELGLMNSEEKLIPFNKAETESSTAENYSYFSHILDNHFQVTLQGTPIVNLLTAQYPNTAQLAADLKMLSHPLYQSKAGGGVPYQVNHMFMRMDANQNPAFFTNLESNVQNQLAGAQEAINPLNNLGHVTSQDPYKFTFLQFHYMMPSKSFALGNALGMLFQQNMASTNLAVDPISNYVFNAEKKAHQFALKRAQYTRMNFNSFKPEVVTLLEQPERTKLFFLAYAQGLLVFKDGMGLTDTVWELKSLGNVDRVILYQKNEANLGSKDKCTVYEALHYWIVGKDYRPTFNQTRINWRALSDLIRENESGLNRDQVLHEYLNQMNIQEQSSIVWLLNQNLLLRSNIVLLPQQGAVQQILQGVVNINQSDIFNDLIDLARVVYQERVDIYKNAGWEG